jgi:hypothetical protein
LIAKVQHVLSASNKIIKTRLFECWLISADSSGTMNEQVELQHEQHKVVRRSKKVNTSVFSRTTAGPAQRSEMDKNQHQPNNVKSWAVDVVRGDDTTIAARWMEEAAGG